MHAAFGVKHHVGAGLQAFYVALPDIGVDPPVQRIDEDSQGFAGVYPGACAPERVDIEPDAGKFCMQFESSQLLSGGLHFSQLLAQAFGHGARLIQATLLRLQAGHLGGEGFRPCEVAGALRAQVGRIQMHQFCTRGDQPAGMDRPDDSRVGRKYGSLTGTVGHPGAADTGLPWDRDEHQDDGRHGAEPLAAPSGNLRAPVTPDPDLPPDRQGDEPGQFHSEKENPQGLEKEQVDRYRDAEKNHQAVQPGHQCKGDEQMALLAGSIPGHGSFSCNTLRRSAARASAEERSCRLGKSSRSEKMK